MLSSTEHSEQPKSLAEVYNLVSQVDPRNRKAMRKAAELLFGFRQLPAGNAISAALPAHDVVQKAERALAAFVVKAAEKLQESELLGIVDEEPAALLLTE